MTAEDFSNKTFLVCFVLLEGSSAVPCGTETMATTTTTATQPQQQLLLHLTAAATTTAVAVFPCGARPPEAATILRAQ